MINKIVFKLVVVIAFWFDYSGAFAQVQAKPAIDFKTYKNWPSIGRIQLSRDGKYVFYNVVDNELKREEYVIKPTNKKWERKYTGLMSVSFIANNKYVALNRIDGSVIYLDLENNKERKEPVKFRDEAPLNFNMDVKWNAVGTGIYITKSGSKIDSIRDVIDCLELVDKHTLALSCKDLATGNNVLYRYNVDIGNKELLFQTKPGEKIELNHFNVGSILFKVVLPSDSLNAQLSSVDIWGYKDPSLPAPFAKLKQELKCRQYVINPTSGKVVALTGSNESVLAVKGDYALIEYRLGDLSFEFRWNGKSKASYYLVSLKDGSKKIINQQNSNGMMEAILSPSGDCVVFKDHGMLKYQAYDVKKSVLMDLNPNTEISVTTIDIKRKNLALDFYWLSNHAVIVNDDYDLWKLDLTGKNPPINLTGGLGKKNNMTFSINKTLHPVGSYLQKSELKGYLLNAFDHRDKSWGFYKLRDLSGKGLGKLSSGPYYYGGENPSIVKADQGGTFLVNRGTATEFPNLFMTHDFKTFTQISDLNPEKAYNWMSSELLHWKTVNGEFRDGILYKPENFDPSKKYPVVVSIYNEFSSGLNKYRGVPSVVSVQDVTWLVSNGYLVFMPDLIHRELGARLKSGYDMLIPGVNHLVRLPFVDSNKIGLQGESWGGEQVNYIVTHSKLFAAAYSGAGFSEQVSGSGFMDRYASYSKFAQNEIHFGGLLTDVPDHYIEESPLFSAHKMETPLLIKFNIDDESVPFYQGFQFFTLLRRLGKKAWMLQYDQGNHGVRPGKDCEDLKMRIAQFFDHYLKGKPAPKWMTQGILPEYKQIDSGLELDSPEVIP
jgi:dienelactone hydrolase